MNTIAAPLDNNQATRLLAAIANFTKATGSATFRRRFVEEMVNSFPVSAIEFFVPEGPERLNSQMRCEVKTTPGRAKLHWEYTPLRNVSKSSALAKCMHEKRHCYPNGINNIDYFPVVCDGELLEIVEIRQQVTQRAERVQFGHLMSIYSNFANILHKKDLDQLTGAQTESAFQEELKVALESLRNERARVPGEEQWWLMLVQADNFQNLIAHKGRASGDQVLIDIRKLISREIRGVDSLFRYENETFAVLLSPCIRKNALNLAGRLSESIQSKPFAGGLNVTASIGLAAIDRYEYSANVVGRATQALLEVQRRGGNQVQAFDERSHKLWRPGLQHLSA